MPLSHRIGRAVSFLDVAEQSATDVPALFVKVEDASRMLGISRSLAYELANRWLDGDRSEGLPCVRFGRRILVQRVALERLGGVGEQ